MTRPGRPLRGLVALGLLVLQAAAPSAQGPGPDATDGDLGRASAGRDVRVAPRGSSGPVAGVPLETYVARVLAGEGEPGAPEAAQQALAIAIRTFAVFNARRHEGEGFDLCDSTHCQVLRAASGAPGSPSPASTRAT
jgi:peptidoglycan hydrolase-like amidase